ncbi:uncharacterized protein METZ01_LOCUS256405 [marine metagenome]|uniref:Uncharacterized protein n=1 Tax=marine metagenome TaxID=408172 RepID=A0A382IYA6_9ZZZZ
MTLEDPLFVVLLLEFDQRLTELFNRGKGADPQ